MFLYNRPTKSLFTLIGACGLVAFAGVSLLPLLFPHHPWFRLIEHFRLQLLVGGFVITLLLIFLRQRRLAIVAAIVASYHLIGAWPYLGFINTAGMQRAQATPSISTSQPVKILWGNLRHRFADQAAVLALIHDEKPDIILLTELADVHLPLLAQLKQDYPYQRVESTFSPFGIGILSREKPNDADDALPFAGHATLSTVRYCAEHGPCLVIAGFHPPRPLPPHGQAHQDLMVDMASIMRQKISQDDDVLLVGDFNSTPFAQDYQSALRISGLVDTALTSSSFPSLPTWHYPIGLPLDHAWASMNLRVLDRHLGPDIGSDHRPLIVVIDRVAPQ